MEQWNRTWCLRTIRWGRKFFVEYFQVLLTDDDDDEDDDDDDDDGDDDDQNDDGDVRGKGNNVRDADSDDEFECEDNIAEQS